MASRKISKLRMKSRVVAQNVPFSSFPKLRLMRCGILASEWADFWYTGVFRHGEFDNEVEIQKYLRTKYRNVEKWHLLMKSGETWDFEVINLRIKGKKDKCSNRFFLILNYFLFQIIAKLIKIPKCH
jgi:hypothetical protein